MKSKGVITLAGLITTMIVAAPLSYADGIVVPMSTKVGMFKKLMKQKGMNLYGRDNSDGHVEDNGSRGIKVITNLSVTDEQLEWIKECAVKAVRK
jgi:hypothetical protein